MAGFHRKGDLLFQTIEAISHTSAELSKLNKEKVHRFMNNCRSISCRSFDRLNKSLFVFTVCAITVLANAANVAKCSPMVLGDDKTLRA